MDILSPYRASWVYYLKDLALIRLSGLEVNGTDLC